MISNSSQLKKIALFSDFIPSTALCRYAVKTRWKPDFVQTITLNHDPIVIFVFKIPVKRKYRVTKHIVTAEFSRNASDITGYKKP